MSIVFNFLYQIMHHECGRHHPMKEAKVEQGVKKGLAASHCSDWDPPERCGVCKISEIVVHTN